jgi:hypothetical protein
MTIKDKGTTFVRGGQKMNNWLMDFGFCTSPDVVVELENGDFVPATFVEKIEGFLNLLDLEMRTGVQQFQR